MSVKTDDEFYKERIMSYLKTLDYDDGRWFSPIVEFVFTDYADDLFRKLNKKFNSKRGPSAYDRRKLFLAMSYSIRFETDHDLTKIARLCRTDKVLGEIMGDDRPCNVTFNNFLSDSDQHTMKKLAICTLMELNDLEFLDFSRLYTDSSDSKINGSVHYKVGEDEVEGIKLMKELGLLHNRSVKQMKLNRRKLLKIKEENRNNSEKCKIIDVILRNFKLYDKRVYVKLEEIEQYLADDPESYVCIMFPESKFMKTKRGKFDFALLVQETMLKNGIICNSLLQSEPNDSKALEEIILDLEDTFKILLDLQIMYGERENYMEIYNALKLAIHVLDSGYFTDENLESAYFHNMKVLIMPRSIARYNNDKLRGRTPEKVEDVLENIKQITMREMKRTYDGYLCLYNVKSQLIDEMFTDSQYNKERENLDDVCKEKKYHFLTDCPCDCPYKAICDKQDFFVKMTPLKYRMLNMFALKKYLKIYAERFGANEQIHGYLKKDKSMLKLAGSNKQAAQNHLYIKMITYNERRKVNLKDTAY